MAAPAPDCTRPALSGSLSHCVKSEIHNVLTVMRLSDTRAREGELYADFRSLLDELHGSPDLVDAEAIVEPFLTLVATSGAEEVADVALTSVHKFLLYGLISSTSINASEAVNLIVATLTRLDERRFWSELATMRVLETLLATLRSPAGHLLTNRSVWEFWCTAQQLSLPARGHSALLMRSAETSLVALVLTVYARLPLCVESAWEEWEPDDGANGAAAAAATAAAAVADDDGEPASHGVLLPPPPPPPPPSAHSARRPDADDAQRGEATEMLYGVPCMYWLLGGLAQLVDPAWSLASARSQQLGLRLINTALEAGGSAFSAAPPLVLVIQESVCKHLLHAAHTADSLLLSLALRAVFNLFCTVREHLKVQLEVFFNSMHLKLLNAHTLKHGGGEGGRGGVQAGAAEISGGGGALSVRGAATVEQQQLTVESLVEFCREPELLVDLYVNYDCDVGCSNLYENLVLLLAGAAIPADLPGRTGGGGGVKTGGGAAALLQPLCFEGVVAILDSLARLCAGGAADEFDGMDGGESSLDG
ncbi:guanine nucleotide exchange factor in Golgi transport N-terminal-domain-containing protein [Pavlovales sp. CCMP2436]|nr:guanine nucleotide exchange factor in Golgi transport N-terminal-domain-containing protein [Pavlovales sp. CCMP2436]